MAVLNLKHDSCSNSIRIDRKSRWGNPYVIGRDGDRTSVIEAHRKWLWKEIKQERVSLQDLSKLANQDLACWCAPKPCHGHTLEKAAKWAVRQLKAKKAHVKL